MENIKVEDLDASKIVVPVGYKVIIDPELIEQERKQQEILELEKMIGKVPTTKELAELGKLYHPYYENLRRLELL